MIFTLHVGSTCARPVRPEQFVSGVTVVADTEAEAIEIATLMTMRPASPAIGLATDVQMPTSALIVDWDTGSPHDDWSVNRNAV